VPALLPQLRFAFTLHHGFRILAEGFDKEVDDAAPKFSHRNLMSGYFSDSGFLILADPQKSCHPYQPGSERPVPAIDPGKPALATAIN
jgi:hypothetical protein